MKTRKLFAALSIAALVAIGALRAEDKKAPKLEGVKCPVSGKDVVAEATVDYKDGKVYLCCEGCPDAFKKDTKKFAAKANQQLIATGQAKQGACPFSGGKLNADATVEVGGAKVAFCCDKCQGKAKGLSEDKQVEALFSDAAFTKGKFKVEKAK